LGTTRVSFRRRRIVAAQAATVALLVFVVYMTLLRPDGPDGLRGIEAPGGGTQVDGGPRGGDGEGSERDGERERRDRRGTLAPRPGPDGAPPAVLAREGTAAAAPGAGVANEGGPTPTDDQYADSVTSLLRKVGSGREIGD
jgi:hypothetical protein